MDRAPDVGLLLKGRRPVYYVGHYRAACAQNALLASVLFWIASLPLMFLSFPELSYLGLIATLVTGGLYWYWHRHAGDETAPGTIASCGTRRGCCGSAGGCSSW